MEMFVYSQVKQKHVALFLSFLRYGPLAHRIHRSDSVLFGSSSPKGWGGVNFLFVDLNGL